jgi:hypothetical protein
MTRQQEVAEISRRAGTPLAPSDDKASTDDLGYWAR